MSDSQKAKEEAEKSTQDESIVSSNAAIESEESNATSKNDAKIDLYDPEYEDEDEDEPEIKRDPIADPYNNVDYSNVSLENINTVSGILRYHRQRMGLTIQEVASAIQARVCTVADIEHDRLNNSSCAGFAKPFIGRYAKLVNLDSEQICAMYLRGISETVAIDHEKSEGKVDKQMARNWLLLVIMILVATAGYFVFSATERKSTQKNNEGTIVTQEATINAPYTSSEPLVSANSNEPVIIEDPDNKNAPEVKVVSPNTAKANAQAKALAESSSEHEANKDMVGSLEKPSFLQLPSDALNEVKPAIKASSSLLADQVETKATMNMSNKAENNKSFNLPVTNQNEPLAKDQGSKVDAIKEPKEEASLKQELNNEEKVELKAKLKDISSKVKLVDREGLASLNSAEIRVLKKVALKVIDSQKKVLASGVYDAPNTIKVTGIPPLVVELSDTQAVKISYQNGKVTMPKDKQVKLELPMRQAQPSLAAQHSALPFFAKLRLAMARLQALPCKGYQEHGTKILS